MWSVSLRFPQLKTLYMSLLPPPERAACPAHRIQIDLIYDIYLSTAIGLTPGGSSTVHIYTQTMHRTTRITINLEECAPCPIFASFIPAFALTEGKVR